MEDGFCGDWFGGGIGPSGTEMVVEGYKAVLVKDTSFKGLWKVSFTLKEF